MMVKDADEFAQQMEYLHTFLREQMTFAQSTYEATAARRRKSSPAYKVGDMVWLDARNIQTQRPAKKLDSRNLGPFKIEQIINPRAYKLALPTSMRIHPVFHTSLLHLDPSNPLPGQTVMYKDEAEPEVVAREDTAEEEWEVSAVLDSRRDGKKRRLRYLVQWVGWAADWRYWEEILPGCDDEVLAFHTTNPKKPGPPTADEYDFENGKMVTTSGEVATKKRKK